VPVLPAPSTRAEPDPYLAYYAGFLDPRIRERLEDQAANIKARYDLLHDELQAELRRIMLKADALADLAALEIDLIYLEELLKLPEVKDDKLMHIRKEIAWREHLYGIMRYNNFNVLEIIRTEIKELPYLVVVSDASLKESCQWKRVSFEEGVTWLPVNAQKTRISLGVVTSGALGVPICRVVASSSTARRLIATGEEIATTPEHHLSLRYAIEEFQSVKLRQQLKLKDMSVNFLQGLVIDMQNLATYMFLAFKNFYDRTSRAPMMVSMGSLVGRIRAAVRSKWFWVAVILGAIVVLAAGQSLGWWDFPILRNIFGVHK